MTQEPISVKYSVVGDVRIIYDISLAGWKDENTEKSKNEKTIVSPDQGKVVSDKKVIA